MVLLRRQNENDNCDGMMKIDTLDHDFTFVLANWIGARFRAKLHLSLHFLACLQSNSTYYVKQPLPHNYKLWTNESIFSIINL